MFFLVDKNGQVVDCASDECNLDSEKKKAAKLVSSDAMAKYGDEFDESKGLFISKETANKEMEKESKIQEEIRAMAIERLIAKNDPDFTKSETEASK